MKNTKTVDISDYKEDDNFYPEIKLLVTIKSFDLQAIRERYLKNKNKKSNRTGSVNRREVARGGIAEITIKEGKIVHSEVLNEFPEPRGVDSYSNVTAFSTENKVHLLQEEALQTISNERIRDELLKIINSERAAFGIEKLRELGFFQFIIPELEENFGVPQNKHHVYNCYEHAVRSLHYAAQQDYSEEVRLASLLHDIGKVVVAVQLPEIKQKIESDIASNDSTHFDAEKKQMGFAHDRVNAWLADHWNLPLTTREGIAYHHRPGSAQYYPNFAYVVHIGDFLARVMEVGSGGDDHLPYLQPEALDHFKINFQNLENVLDSYSEELLEVSGLSPTLDK